MHAKIKNLIEFFSPAAFEARSRRREQLALRRELAEVDGMREWCDGREAFILGRLAALGQQDAEAVLAAMGIKPGSLLARQAVGRALRKPAADEAHSVGAAG